MKLSRRWAGKSWVGAALFATSRVSSSAPAVAPLPVPETCRGLQITLLGEPAVPWAEALSGAVSGLRARSDVDRCAVVELQWSNGAMLVSIATRDRRTAQRRVLTPAELAVTLDALVTLPPSPAPSPLSLAGRSEMPDSATDGSSAEERHAVAEFEVGGGTSGRIAGGPLYGGIGIQGFAQVDHEPWLIAASARWDVANDLLFTPSPSGFNMQTFSLGVSVGHRWRPERMNLDAMVGPTIVVENQEAEGAADGLGGTASDVRAAALLRVSGPRDHRARFFASADFDVSPARLRRRTQLDSGLPALPSWSMGLQVGLLWGTP